MSSVGLCVQFLLYPTLIIYCPENCIIIFIEKRFLSNRIPILVFDNRTFERVPGNRVLVVIPILNPKQPKVRAQVPEVDCAYLNIVLFKL
jgi:hypothetical protein